MQRLCVPVEPLCTCLMLQHAVWLIQASSAWFIPTDVLCSFTPLCQLNSKLRPLPISVSDSQYLLLVCSGLHLPVEASHRAAKLTMQSAAGAPAAKATAPQPPAPPTTLPRRVAHPPHHPAHPAALEPPPATLRPPLKVPASSQMPAGSSMPLPIWTGFSPWMWQWIWSSP